MIPLQIIVGVAVGSYIGALICQQLYIRRIRRWAEWLKKYAEEAEDVNTAAVSSTKDIRIRSTPSVTTGV